MEEVIIKRILKLNKQFYQRYAGEFSNSRSAPWKGWGWVTEIIADCYKNVNKPISITDLGCGNCRLYGYLTSALGIPFTYQGFDESSGLTEIAGERYKENTNFSVEVADVIKGINAIKSPADVVCAFGLTHHIPSEELRRYWFSSLPALLKTNGLLVLSFWNTDKKPAEGVGFEIDRGSKFLGWNGSDKYKRYVHTYSDSEINDVILLLQKNNTQLIGRSLDGIENKSGNLYLVFKKLV